MRARRAVTATVVAMGVLLAWVAPAAARPHALAAHGAVLAAPAQPLTRELQPDQGCQVLLDNGTGKCAVVQTSHGPLVFTVEAVAAAEGALVSRPWVVRVYAKSATVPNGWQVGLETKADPGEPGVLYANVIAKIADVTGDGKDELLVGYRSEGTGEILDYDIVGTDTTGTPVVLAHQQLYKGTVVVRPGRLITYAPVYRPHDANCCPTWIERDVVRYQGGEFVVHPGPRTPTRKTHEPPGDLG
jgi:hypothetical protein